MTFPIYCKQKSNPEIFIRFDSRSRGLTVINTKVVKKIEVFDMPLGDHYYYQEYIDDLENVQFDEIEKSTFDVELEICKKEII